MPFGGGYVAMNDFQSPSIKRSGIINRLFEKKHVRLEEEEGDRSVGGGDEIDAAGEGIDEHTDEPVAATDRDPSTAPTSSVVAPHIQESTTDIEVHHRAMHVHASGDDDGMPGGSDGRTRGTEDDGDGPPGRRAEGPPPVDHADARKQNPPTASPDVRTMSVVSPRQKGRRSIRAASPIPSKWRGKTPTPELSGAARKRMDQRPPSQQPTTMMTQPPPRRTLHSIGDDGEGIETYVIQADCLRDFRTDRGARAGAGADQAEDCPEWHDFPADGEARAGAGADQAEDCPERHQSPVDPVPPPPVDAEETTSCRESRTRSSDAPAAPEPPRHPPHPAVEVPVDEEFAFTRLASPYEPSRKRSPCSVMLLDVEEEGRGIAGGGEGGETGGPVTHVGSSSSRNGPEGSDEGEPRSNNSNGGLDLRSIIEQSVGSRVEWMMKNLHDRVDGGGTTETRFDEGQRVGVGGGGGTHHPDSSSSEERTYSLSRMSSIVQKVVDAIGDSTTHLTMETTKGSEEESTLPSEARHGGGGHRERNLHRSNSSSASQMIKKALTECAFPTAEAYGVDAANVGNGKHGRTKKATIPHEIVVLRDDDVESAVVPPAEITCEQQDLFSVGDLTDYGNYDEVSIRRSESYLR